MTLVDEVQKGLGTRFFADALGGDVLDDLDVFALLVGRVLFSLALLEFSDFTLKVALLRGAGDDSVEGGTLVDVVSILDIQFPCDVCDMDPGRIL